ncbi:zinc finger HIT domain-containing protein 2 [Bombina bombina]|uniref:zinc finger HIT domain-containing protein 2 n=1 Tax=Bombina bombina TaxID=8345 RepID=UPI00235AC9B7|nr:zinc finger HIT domain-containing protein 2 [Bombina bombina]
MEVPEPEILLPARAISPTPLLTASSKSDAQVPGVCSLCFSGPGRYTCPRCNAQYCSLACYRGPRHEACSESFYRESVLQALREEQSDPQERRQVEEMLLKLRDEEAMMEKPGLDAHSEGDGKESNLWSSLTDSEKKDFHRLLQNGGIGVLVPQWKPWWHQESAERTSHKISELRHQGQVTVSENGNSLSQGDNHSKTLPSASNVSHHQLPSDHEEAPEYVGQKKTRIPIVKNELTNQKEKHEDHIERVSRLSPSKSSHGEQERDKQVMTDLHNVADSSDGGGWEDAGKTPHRSDSQYNSGMTHQNNVKSPCSVGEEKDISAKSIDLHVLNCISEQVTTRGDGLDPKQKISEVPAVFKSIPSLHSLSRNPSPLVRYSVVNTIYAYAFSLQRHNGDLSDNDALLDFTGTLLSVSGALSSTVVYNSTALALQSAVRLASDPQLGGDEGGACNAIESTAHILLGDGTHCYTLAALSDLSHLLGRARKLAEDDVGRRAAFNAKKKCLFLAAWVNENASCLAILSIEAKRQHDEHLKYLTGVTEIAKRLEKSWGGKRPHQKKQLIQEINEGQV